MKFSREWAMPCSDTFDVPCIGWFVRRHLLKSNTSVDPFARNKRWATYTNDLNPNTTAESHVEAADFLNSLKGNGILVDLAIFDPPYSLTQVARSYQDIGLDFKGDENPTGGFPKVRDLLSELLITDGICLSFGWNSVGLGKGRGFEIMEIMLVCHGGNRNDTICMAERKLPQTVDLQQTFSAMSP